jgi:hypothetical protein
MIKVTRLKAQPHHGYAIVMARNLQRHNVTWVRCCLSRPGQFVRTLVRQQVQGVERGGRILSGRLVAARCRELNHRSSLLHRGAYMLRSAPRWFVLVAALSLGCGQGEQPSSPAEENVGQVQSELTACCPAGYHPVANCIANTGGVYCRRNSGVGSTGSRCSPTSIVCSGGTHCVVYNSGASVTCRY